MKLTKSLTMLEIKYLMRILVSIGEWSLLSRLFTETHHMFRVHTVGIIDRLLSENFNSPIIVVFNMLMW